MSTATETEAAEPSAWSTFKEAVRGSHQDFTQAPIGRAVVLLAVPMVLEMLMNRCSSWRTPSSSAGWAPAPSPGGAHRIADGDVYALAIGLSIGAAATVARRIGEKDPERAALSAVQAIILGIGVAVLIGAVGIAFGPNLLVMMARGRTSWQSARRFRA
jgi:Na+-driven multidrug efflux pump